MNIRKRLLSFIICGVMAFSACPLTAFAGDGETGDAIVEETECICETLCTEEEVNGDCPVCSKDWENCEGEEPECECETLCTEEEVNDDCPVCSENWEDCEGKEPEPECDCETLCDEENINDDCPVCSENWEDCEGEEPENGIMLMSDEDIKLVDEVDKVYEIYTAEGLREFAKMVNSGKTDICAKLTEDIVIQEGVLKADGSLNGDDFDQWTPIGSKNNPYTGTFDGDGHSISGLYIDSNAGYIGLFGYIGEAGAVKNVGIVDSYVNGTGEYPHVGAVCGHNSGTVEYCYNTGNVNSSLLTSSDNFAGGICGQNMNTGKIDRCYNTGTVSGRNAGGVCGYNDKGEISNCYNTGTVSGRNAGGVCGINYTTVTNCYNTGTVSSSGLYAGGVCGFSDGTVENCYNTGTVSGTSSINYAGGVCGYNRGTITNCYNTGAVSGTTAGGVCGFNNNKMENCYYLSETASSGVGNGTDTSTALTVEQMTGSAARTYMSSFDFTNTWGTREGISTMAAVEVALSYYPYLQVFSPESAPKAETLEIIEMDEDGNFLIETAEELQKFADIVNGTLSDVEKAAYKSEYDIKFDGDEKKINVKLTADIVLNDNVLNADGNLNGDGSKFDQWTPIGQNFNKRYEGTFDGQNYAISGLYINDYGASVGLFAFIGSGAEVKNVGIEDSYINISIDYAGGAICGANTGSITNCYNTGTVSGAGISYVGGICGYNSGNVEYCYNTGNVSGGSNNNNYAGGVCGQNMNTGKIENCYNIGTVSSTGAGSGNYAGGVCGRNMNNGKIENCYNTGTVSITGANSGNYAGGVCGRNMDNGTIENCYNTGAVSSTGAASGNYAGGVCGNNYDTVENCYIENCYNTGAVTGTYAGGVCGNNYGSVKNCYNTGIVSGEYAGGVCGFSYGTVENCYNTGAVSGSSSAGVINYVGGVCGNNYNGTVTNCYYLSETANSGVGSNSGTAADIEEKSQSQFSSGEVAWLLQNGQEEQVWGQKIGTDELPRLSYNEDDKVCKVTFMNGGDEVKTVYINMGGTIAEPDIDVGKGFYVDGWYTDSDLDGDEWDFENDTIDDDITLYADVEGRKSSGGSYSLSEGIDRDEPKDEPEEEPEVEPDTPGTTGFIDVSIFDWYYDGVMYATEKGIMNGVGGNRFEPETELKREMLAVILWNMTDNPEPNGIAPFLDVTSDKYYAEAIAWANENGVMYGYGEEFGVGEAVTREDFAAILYRYAAFKGYDTTQGGMAIREFIDFDQIADYAVEALGWAVNSGIISGMGDGTVSPKTSTYRGQAAVMLMKFCENIMK